MKGFKKTYKNIFHYYNEHGSHENSIYEYLWISNPNNQTNPNKLVRLPYSTPFSQLASHLAKRRIIYWNKTSYI